MNYRRIFFLSFAFLSIFVFYKYYLYCHNQINNNYLPREKKKRKENEKEVVIVNNRLKKKEFSLYYYFLLMLIILIIFFIFFTCSCYEEKKEKEENKEKEKEVSLNNDDNDGETLFVYKQDDVYDNNKCVYSEKKFPNSITLEKKIIDQTKKLKKDEMVVLTKKQIFKKNKDNGMTFLINEKIEHFDKYCLDANKISNIKKFLKSEMDFMVDFLYLFLKFKLYFHHLKIYNENKKNFWHFSFFKADNIRQEESELQAKISSLYRKILNAREDAKNVAIDFDIQLTSNNFFDNLKKDVDFLTEYQDGGFYSEDRKENRKKFKEAMKRFDEDTLYKIYECRLEEQNILLSILKEKDIIKNYRDDRDDNKMTFDNEKDFENIAKEDEKNFFNNTKERIKEFFLMKLNENN